MADRDVRAATLVRYNSDGTLDTTFDTDGKVTTDFGSSFDEAYGVAIDDAGKIVVVGFSYKSGAGWDFALARYDTDGTLDTTFDSDGRVTTDFGSVWNFARSVAIDSAGNIVVAGYSSQSGTGDDFALARYIGAATTPQEHIELITADVQVLVSDGVLNNGQGNALTAKLDTALAKLDQRNTTAAVNVLQAFINQVNAFMNAGNLSAAEGQSLIDAANGVIASVTPTTGASETSKSVAFEPDGLLRKKLLDLEADWPRGVDQALAELTDQRLWPW